LEQGDEADKDATRRRKRQETGSEAVKEWAGIAAAPARRMRGDEGYSPTVNSGTFFWRGTTKIT